VSRLPQRDARAGADGALIGSVKDAQGSVISGAVVRVTSPALIGGPSTVTTNEKGQLRFPALPSGSYGPEIKAPGFAIYHEGDISIGAGASIERTVVLNVASVAESVVVEGRGSSLEARGALNDRAEEGVATDNLFSSSFGQPTVFLDPRRAMLSVRLNLGR
jgi:hypothetical protein